MFPAGLEPATFRVLGGRDNHYTTETSLKEREKLIYINITTKKFVQGVLENWLIEVDYHTDYLIFESLFPICWYQTPQIEMTVNFSAATLVTRGAWRSAQRFKRAFIFEVKLQIINSVIPSWSLCGNWE